MELAEFPSHFAVAAQVSVKGICRSRHGLLPSASCADENGSRFAILWRRSRIPPLRTAGAVQFSCGRLPLHSILCHPQSPYHPKRFMQTPSPTCLPSKKHTGDFLTCHPRVKFAFTQSKRHLSPAFLLLTDSEQICLRQSASALERQTSGTVHGAAESHPISHLRNGIAFRSHR